MDLNQVPPAVRSWDVQELTAIAANETPYAVYVTDAEARIIYVNRMFTEMLGYEFSDVRDRRPREILGARHYMAKDYERILKELHRGRDVRDEVRTFDKAGTELWLSVTLRPVLRPDGSLGHILGILENTTEIRQIQALQRDVLEAVATDLPLRDVMKFICDQVEVIFPEVVISILAVDETGRLRTLAAPSLPENFSEAIDGALIGPAVGSCGTAAYRHRPVQVDDIENDPLWADYKSLPLPLGLLACWSSPIKLQNGRVAGTFAFYFREKRGPSVWHEAVVTACVQLCSLAFERHEAQARIAKLAYYDTLTGLPNRTQLRQQLEVAFAADPLQTRAFLFLDIDRFKDVNDTMGHPAGDSLLVEVAGRLQKQVGAGDIVCRHGGDEFVIVLSDSSPEAAVRMVERIEAALAEPTQIGGFSLPITASIGVSLYPRDGIDADAVLKNSDTAMYRAKAEGRACHRFYSAEMNELAQERVLLGAALREAIATRGLTLNYQPQVSAVDGSLTGVEALARWSHPKLGQIAPDRFIKLAEESGLIDDLGEWVVDEACRQLRAWDDAGVAVPAVAVNISPLHFRTRSLEPIVAAALSRHRLAPGRLSIEITEGAAMDDCSIAMANAHALHDLGVRLSMDDFGTGFSSLSHLARLPVDELKIDKCFVQDLEGSDSSRTLVTAVIRIGQSLGLTVVAEGVETAAQQEVLEALGCDVLQGFLFSKALAPAALSSWLSHYKYRPKLSGAA